MVQIVKHQLLRGIWQDYSIFEKAFMLILTALQIVVFILNPDSLLGIIAGISGVISVVLCAKGKISFYFIGFVQTTSYLILSWQNKFYGEVVENIFYLITMIIGIFLWKKNMFKNENGLEQVKTKAMTTLQWILSIVGTIVFTIITGYILNLIGSNQPYTDAATNVIAIFAQILMIKRYKEQWIWWLVLNVLCVKLWVVAENWSMVAMYIAWIINCIYGWYNWSKLNKVGKLI